MELEHPRNAKAWCSIHECNPSDCFRKHNPNAYRKGEDVEVKETDVQGE